MQSATTGNYSEKSHITLLQTVDLSASNPTVIYSVVQFICKQAAKWNIGAPCITFDQPLYIKTFKISRFLQMSIVKGLGGFHLLISFLGCIGSVIEPSVLKRWSWKQICTDNSLAYTDWQSILKGTNKKFSAESAFFALILSNAISEDFQTDDQNRMNEMNETENKTESRMNETENNQIVESESTNEGPFSITRKEPDENKKSPNCLTKNLQELIWIIKKFEMSSKN